VYSCPHDAAVDGDEFAIPNALTRDWYLSANANARIPSAYGHGEERDFDFAVASALLVKSQRLYLSANRNVRVPSTTASQRALYACCGLAVHCLCTLVELTHLRLMNSNVRWAVHIVHSRMSSGSCMICAKRCTTTIVCVRGGGKIADYPGRVLSWGFIV